MSDKPVILCVDDDPDILASVGRFLRRDGYQVILANTPAEALEILASRTVAVLVSDVDMPEMNGLELAVRAREVQPDTVRVLLTARNTVATVTDGVNRGEIYRFLAKPFEPDMLRREVAAAVAHHGELSAVAHARSTVVRRQRLLAALEADHPGITMVPRDEGGAYLLDPDARRRPVGPALVAIAALFPRSA